MAIVSVSDLRQNLPAFLKRVQAGEELQVTSRGRIIARIAPERDPAEEARQWLFDLRDRVSLGDVVQGIPEVEWRCGSSVTPTSPCSGPMLQRASAPVPPQPWR